MKLNKYFVAGCLASSMFFAVQGAVAQTEAEANEYIKNFGYLVGERSGLTELKLTDAEFAIFLDGLKSSATGAKLPENMQQLGQKMSEYLQARAAKNAAEVAKKNEAEASDFWKNLEKNAKVSKTPSGLFYEIIEPGTPPLPTEASSVEINYTGTLINGEVFDSSKNSGAPAKFPLANVIPGFREGLQKIGKGGKIKLFIPPALGYGNQALPGIPAGSTLIFEVELLDVQAMPSAPMPAQPALPPAPPAPSNN